MVQFPGKENVVADMLSWRPDMVAAVFGVDGSQGTASLLQQICVA